MLGLIAFLIVDLVVLAFVVAAILDARGRLAPVFKAAQRGVDMKALTALMKDEHPAIGQYLRSSWDGSPDGLPLVLGNLMAQLDQKARARGLKLEHETLKSLVSGSLKAHGRPPEKVLREALAKVS